MKNLKEKQFQNKMKVIAGIIISITVENNIIFICYKVGVGLYTFAIVSMHNDLKDNCDTKHDLITASKRCT